MPIFQIKNNKFTRLKEKNFNYEKDLQKLVEQNLGDIFGLEFVSGALDKQFILKNFEVDTVAFDPQTNSFTIIEYKKDKSFSIIDQGYTYLSLLLNNKADFVLHYNEKSKKNLGIKDADWSQSKIIFIAKEFTPYQKGAIGFRGLPIELWEVQLMEGNLVAFNLIKAADTQESIMKITKSHAIEKVSQEVKSYTLDDHYRSASPETKVLFDKLREQIFALDENIKEKPVRAYVGYKLNWFNFVSVHVYKAKLKLYVRKNELEKDSKKMFTKVPSSYGWGKTSLWWFDISKDLDLPYVMEVVRESYEAAPD